MFLSKGTEGFPFLIHFIFKVLGLNFFHILVVKVRPINSGTRKMRCFGIEVGLSALSRVEGFKHQAVGCVEL